MKISIDQEVLNAFPDAAIGYLTADVEVGAGGEYVEGLKSGLLSVMDGIGLSAANMMEHPDVARWREVFGKMGVKPSKYKSSLEALLRRLFKGELWSVSNVVDLYDCVSVQNLLPMGAHDMAKLKGDLTLRYGREGEKFMPLGTGSDVVDVDPRQIVYADDEKILCWLWNHRDTREATVTDQTKRAIFMVDNAFRTEWRTVGQGLDALESELVKIGARVDAKGIIDAGSPFATVEA